jgi:hypothetical protein
MVPRSQNDVLRVSVLLQFLNSQLLNRGQVFVCILAYSEFKRVVRVWPGSPIGDLIKVFLCILAYSKFASDAV